MSDERTKRYDQYKDMPIEELAQSIVGGIGNGSEFELKKLVYEQKVIDRKHRLDLELLDKQAKIIKSSNRIIAIATISAALLGAIVGAVLQYKLTQKPEAAIQKTEQPSEVRTPDKISTSPPPQK